MKLILVGTGRMGCFIRDLAVADGDEVVMMVDEKNIHELKSAEKVDAVIDFSVPSALPSIADYIQRCGSALVSGTTGYTDEEFSSLTSLSEYAAVIHSANYSFGVAVMRKMLEQFSKNILNNKFDVELVEAHHNKKADSPSGTAKLLMNAVDPDKELTPVYGRSGICGARDKKEFGVHAVRGGTVSGTHTVSFFGEDESIEITHTATSRRIFAAGSLAAAAKMKDKPKGLYTFDEIMF